MDRPPNGRELHCNSFEITFVLQTFSTCLFFLPWHCFPVHTVTSIFLGKASFQKCNAPLAVQARWSCILCLCTGAHQKCSSITQCVSLLRCLHLCWAQQDRHHDDDAWEFDSGNHQEGSRSATLSILSKKGSPIWAFYWQSSMYPACPLEYDAFCQRRRDRTFFLIFR